MSPRRRPASAGETRPAALHCEGITASDDHAGFRIVTARHAPRSTWILDGQGATAIMIVVAGSAREDTAAGTVMLPRSTIAVRPPARPFPSLEAGPSGAQTVTIELTDRALRAHPPAEQLLTTRQTFRGRSSVELAWRIAGELLGPDAMTPSALRVLVSGIVIGTSRFSLHHREAAATHPMAAAAQRILDRQLATPPSLRKLAQRVGCSPEHLARIFRASFGFSVRDWITRRRVERGKLLLTESRRQIGEIAHALGFCDASHFARAFKRATTTTPARFRATHADINPVLSGAAASARGRAGAVRSLHD